LPHPQHRVSRCKIFSSSKPTRLGARSPTPRRFLHLRERRRDRGVPIQGVGQSPRTCRPQPVHDPASWQAFWTAQVLPQRRIAGFKPTSFRLPRELHAIPRSDGLGPGWSRLAGEFGRIWATRGDARDPSRLDPVGPADRVSAVPAKHRLARRDRREGRASIGGTRFSSWRARQSRSNSCSTRIAASWALSRRAEPDTSPSATS
jgi:hypothetical protein